MAAYFGTLFGWLIAFCVFVAGVVIAIAGGRRRSRRLTSFGGLLVSGVLVASALVALRYRILPLTVQASSIVSLPKEAQILTVKHANSYASDSGIVTFRLPNTKPVHEWIKAVWDRNVGEDPDGGVVKGGLVWMNTGEGTELYKLSYDPVNNVYQYEAEPDDL